MKNFEFKNLLDGGFLVKKSFLSFLPAILLGVVLIVVYIGNRYYIETTLKKMDNMQLEINALQKKYSDQKGAYQKTTQMLEIDNKLQAQGVKVSKEKIKQTILY
ncbi:MAG: hypothetical protein H6Q15_1586 [Bacteroidetes bacterium]|nr:hypothetical protein [Bacteroidota bacterium]